MRLRNIAGADDYINNSPFVIKNYKDYKGKWNSLFKKTAPIHIEIGMGKGRFMIDMASNNPEINFIGIEMYSSVLLRAVQKIEESTLTNLLFIRMDAKEIEEVFDKNEIDKIYLNFSDPWPKDRHAKRRLPSHQFLTRFSNVLSSHGTLEFKTDNRSLFDFAVEEIKIANWKLIALSYDLHNDPKMNEGNIMTEYEEKFSSLGNPIFKYIIKAE